MVWINRTNLFDAAARLRRLPRERLRPRGRPRGPVRVRQAHDAETPPERRSARRRPMPPLDAAVRAELRSLPADRPHAPSSTSAASRRGPTPATACRCIGPHGQRGRRGGRGQPQGHPQRRRGRARRRRAGRGRPRTTARRSSTTSPRTWPRAPRSSPPRLRALTGDAPDGAAGGRGRDRAALHLRRLGRQVRRRRPPHAAAQRHAGDERADRRDRHRLPGRGPAARLRLAAWRRRSPWATRWCCALRAPPARRHRPLPGARDLRRARRRRQHRHRRAATRWRRCWPSTTTWTRSGTSGRPRAAPWWSAPRSAT